MEPSWVRARLVSTHDEDVERAVDHEMTLKGARSRKLGELYAQHAPGAGRLAFLLVGDRAIAEDLVQDAFVRVAAKVWTLRNPNAFEAYLRRTVVNLARGYMRRAQRERAYASDPPEPFVSFTDASSRDELLRALAILPHRQRAAIVLRYYADLSEAQTADQLGCPVGTVKSLVSRGLTALREQMRGED